MCSQLNTRLQNRSQHNRFRRYLKWSCTGMLKIKLLSLDINYLYIKTQIKK